MIPFICITVTLLFLLFYFIAVMFISIDGKYKNFFNEYEILSVEYDGKQYYAANVVYHHLFGFIKCWQHFGGFVTYKINSIHIDTPCDMTLFENKDDLVAWMDHLYKEYNATIKIEKIRN